jgi:arabinofuranosyltransferase
MARRDVNFLAYIILAAIVTGFVIHCVALNFTQDDAFISYRYVRNVIQGHGLVFNPGERVEGYTNFLWIIVLAAFARFGANMITLSKILGVAAGSAALILTYGISALLIRTEHAVAASSHRPGPVAGKSTRPPWLFALFPPLLLAANSAFAYWSISGLETSFFVMSVLLAVYLYLADRRMVFFAAALASLTRPEGVLVFALIMLHRLLTGAERPKARLRAVLEQVMGFAVLVVPFLVFRILYYRDILPNPFYAKTGLSVEYLKSGLAYFWMFLRHYGLWGAVYLLPVLFYRRLGPKGRFVLAFLYSYSTYVILVGGDVLRAHRFFLPVLPFAYLVVTFALIRLYSVLGRARRQAGQPTLSVLLVTGFAVLSFFLPRAYMLSARTYELGLYAKMVGYSQSLRHSFGQDFTLAATTIGAVSYLTDVTVIDMLGLTDRYIAKHPESIPGLASAWKERTFNTEYVLSRNPDVILFSTGMRPSAPAEKALFLSSKFRQNYYTYYLGTILGSVYKKKGNYSGENIMFSDPTFVDLYAEAIYLTYKKGGFAAALDKLEEVTRLGPKDFARAYEMMGTCYFTLGKRETAEVFARKAILMDDYCVEAHHLLETVYLARGDSTAASQERAKVLAYNPERYDKR